jgi:putative PIN family toxin of toxin-antitoxin system
MRIAVDTAILIRGHFGAAGPARELLELVRQSGGRLVLSAYILAEVDCVLRYPRIQALYHLTDGDIWRYLHFLESIGDIIDLAEAPPVVLKDPDDDPIVYTARAGHADILCTVDKHFYEPNVLAFCTRYQIRIMTDAELLQFLRHFAPGR